MYNNELYHHGVKGQKWGVRRYQNKDGSLTSAGKKRARTKDSFNTNHRPTQLTRRGELVASKPDGVSKRQYNKAKRAAFREGYAYDKTFKSQAKLKDKLSVMGNKYDSEIDKYSNENSAKAYQKAYMKDAEAAYKRAGIKNFNPKTGDYTIDKNGTYRHKKTGAVISEKDFKMAWDYSAEQRYRKERAQQWLVASPILAVSAASIVAVGADYALNKR